jgi:hypothetical protein
MMVVRRCILVSDLLPILGGNLPMSDGDVQFFAGASLSFS